MSEEIGKTARSFVDTLKDQPLSLALVVMNIGLLGFLYYTGVVAHHERQREMEMLYENRKYVADILSRCTIAPSERK